MTADSTVDERIHFRVLTVHGFNPPIVVACGIPKWKRGAVDPARVTCEDCLASQVYKDTVLLIELAFDGNQTDFINSEWVRLQRDRIK